MKVYALKVMRELDSYYVCRYKGVEFLVEKRFKENDLRVGDIVWTVCTEVKTRKGKRALRPVTANELRAYLERRCSLLSKQLDRLGRDVESLREQLDNVSRLVKHVYGGEVHVTDGDDVVAGTVRSP